MLNFDMVNTYTTYIAAVTVFLAFLELGYDLYKKRDRDLKEVLANIGVIALTRAIASVTTAVVLFELMLSFEPHAFFKFNLGSISTYLVAFLLADFCYYLSHYFSHKIRLFWAVHGVHHSSHEFNLFTAFRLNWLTPMVDIFFYSWPVLIFGVDALALSAMRIMVLVLQFWIHNNKMGPMPWFDVIFNSPANHILHHSVEPKHRDKNFGGVFMLYDHIFGTYMKPNSKKKPNRFGVCTPVNSYNPIRIFLHEFIVWYNESKTRNS